MEKEKLHMTIATGIYPPSIGGPASYSKLLADEFDEYGYSINVVTFDSFRKYPKGISHLLYFFTLLKKSVGTDFLYVMDPVTVGLPAFLVSLFVRKPYLLRLGGDYAWEQGVARFGVLDTLDDFVVRKQDSIPVRILQKVQAFVARHSKKVIVPSKYLGKIVEKWGIESSQIKVIYNAFEPASFLLKEKVPSKQVSIISVGRLVAWKGFRELVYVTNKLVKEGISVTLSIVGSGPLQKELEDYITELDAGEYITMKGVLSKKDLEKEMLEHDVFALYTGYEGFSHLILEAMSLGVPILTTKVGGNTEVLQDRENAILIDRDKEALEKSLKEIVLDETLRKKLSSKAQQDVRRFSKKNMFIELDETIRNNISV